MKKKVFGKGLSRSRTAKKALFRALIRALVLHGSIQTTRAKAKAVIPEIDKLVNIAKQKNVNSKRRVYSLLGNDRKVTDLLFSQVIPVFSKKESGFTRLINLPARRGDRAEMVRIEWTEKVMREGKKANKKVGKKVDGKKKTNKNSSFGKK
jgi:large subunit ribosomal protein L17